MMSDPIASDRRRGRRIVFLARRLHLWCGLALVPWILLYAVSGWLFNHPAAFEDETTRQRFALDADTPSAAAMLPEPEAAAQAVLEELATRAGAASIEARSTPRPRFERGVAVEGTRDGATVRLFMDPGRRRGSIDIAAPEVEDVPGALASVDTLDVPGAGEAEFRSAAEAAFVELGHPMPADLKVTSTPRLVFGVDVDGEPWTATWSAKGGTISFRRDDGEVSVKRTLARLHMTHVYPGRFGPAWIHTLIVDLVATCLLVWCVTGLVMWWQMRKLRRVGLMVIVSAMAASLWVLGGVLPGLSS